ncbi:MAG: Cation transporting ATPase, E1-E2 family [Candidatus Levybacteria bacterium GW2011_GWA2_40_8]|nr:MAG: Cation transporting ATPase, E1-E2 family [Candidatus Levybacteria bacterium GW2011_GWA2_40_8]
MTEESVIAYTCPMHPEIKRNKPGMCPECGMNLVKSKDLKTKDNEKETHGKHEGHSLGVFIRKFWISLILTIPIILYSDIVENLFRFEAPSFNGSGYVPLILGSAVFFYGGWIFLKGALREIKGRLPGMMTLIALAISVAYVYSVFTSIFGGVTLFWELSTLITIMLLGHYFEMRAVQGAQGALKELSKLLPDVAEVIKGGETKITPLDQVKENDIVFVRPGGKIPTDGEVIEGDSEVNEAMITGESRPVSKKIGDKVIAGTINGSGSLKLKVTEIGEKTFLAGVMRLIEEAQASKSRLQILSDKAAFYLTFIAIATGSVTLFAWLSQGDVGFAFERTVAVLVIACPHALGLAVPLVASISTTMAARSGLLVRQRLALESARDIDIVLFDKTGTLTQGAYGVSKIWNLKDLEETELLRIAASVESHSEHFTAKAIVDEATKRKIELLPVKNFQAIAGRGVKANLNQDEIKIGGTGILENKILPSELGKEIQIENRDGKTIIYILRNSEIIGLLSLSDIIREESRDAIKNLREMGIKTSMITGDSEDVAKWVSKELGIDEYFSNVRPEDKANKVRVLQEGGRRVAMVGDGINDAPALTQADLGIAIGAGTNVAVESAGIILVRNDPRDIVKIIRLSKLTYNKMVQNLFWATGYNLIALPLAAGVLAFKGIFLEPAVAALFMSASTVIVAVNAVLLKRAEKDLVKV